MIVGTTKLNYSELKRFVGRPAELVTYVESLVPSWARNVPYITQNQRYFVAIHLRNVLTIPYKPRMELVNALVDKIALAGIMTDFTPITEIVDSCDTATLAKLVEVKLRVEN